jgi:hypothetical protein
MVRQRVRAAQKCYCTVCRGTLKCKSTIYNHKDRPRWVPHPPAPAPAAQLQDNDWNWRMDDLEDWENPEGYDEDDADDSGDRDGPHEDEAKWAANLRRRMWEHENLVTDMDWPEGIIPTVLESICILQSVAASHRSSIASLEQQYKATCLLLPPGHGMVSYYKAQVPLNHAHTQSHIY